MTRASSARHHRRAMRKAGVAVAVREVVTSVVFQPSSINLGYYVSRALESLEREGADLTSRIAITIGNDHPNFPGQTVVEAKAAAAVTPSRASFDYQADAVDNDRDDAGQ